MILAVVMAIAGSAFYLSSVDRRTVQPIAHSTAIDVNLADAATLELLPMIGPGLAARIIEYRIEHGPFESVDHLIRVKRIGPATLARVRPFVICRTTSQDKMLAD